MGNIEDNAYDYMKLFGISTEEQYPFRTTSTVLQGINIITNLFNILYLWVYSMKMNNLTLTKMGYYLIININQSYLLATKKNKKGVLARQYEGNHNIKDFEIYLFFLLYTETCLEANYCSN